MIHSVNLTCTAHFSLKSIKGQPVHKNESLIHYASADDIIRLNHTFPAFMRKSDTFTKYRLDCATHENLQPTLLLFIKRVCFRDSLSWLKEDYLCDSLHRYFSDSGGK